MAALPSTYVMFCTTATIYKHYAAYDHHNIPYAIPIGFKASVLLKNMRYINIILTKHITEQCCRTQP